MYLKLNGLEEGICYCGVEMVKRSCLSHKGSFYVLHTQPK